MDYFSYLLEAVNISNKMKDKLVVTAAPDTVREESGCSEPNENDKRRDDDRDDNVDAKDDQPDQKQQRYLQCVVDQDCILCLILHVS